MTEPTTNSITIIVAEPGPNLDACFAIRRVVFVDEQRVSPDLEFDNLDGSAIHYLAVKGGIPIGCARVLLYDIGEAKIGRVAVLANERRSGVGRALMIRAVDDLRNAGRTKVVLHAQIAASRFYEQLGFVREGDEFDEADIPHCRMTLDLLPASSENPSL